MAKTSLVATRKRGSLTKWINTGQAKLEDASFKEALAVEKDFQKSIAHWKTEVKFNINEGASYVGARVWTTNPTYVGVNSGVPAHWIFPKKGQFLFFKMPYTAKTSPGSLSSGSGGMGNEQGVAKEVYHPGTKAREFHKLVADLSRPRYQKRIQTAVKQLSN